jgi:transcriptional regulator with XRE-family HTH domain
MARDSDQPALGLFAAELQAARARAGLSREQLAGRLSYSPSLVAMIETRRRVPTADFARRCDEVLGTPGTFGRLQQHVRTAPFPPWFRPFVEYEARAVTLRGFEHVLVPGLLQTAGYARSVLATRPHTTDDQIEERLSARLDRQTILERDQPPALWAVLDEAVLHRDVGGAKVMHDQLLHLATMAGRPGITIQVIPATVGVHSGLEGAFVLMEFADEPTVAYLETVVGGQITEEPSTVGTTSLIFDTLRSEALPWRASRDLITEVAEERWT